MTFDPNGGTLAEADKTKSLMTGEPYGTLPVPSYEGYDFAGWYTEQNGGTKIESDTTVTVPVRRRFTPTGRSTNTPSR